MKKLDVSACSPTNILFTKSGTFEFLQLSYRELFAATMIGMIGKRYDATKVYILYGCEALNLLGITAVQSGAVFFNGEIYISPFQNPTPGAGVLVANLLVSQYTTNADPTDFSDGTPRNVHNIRTITYSYGTSGTGTFTGGASANNDITNFIRISDVPFVEITSFGTPEVINFNASVTYSYTNSISGAHEITIDQTSPAGLFYYPGKKVKMIIGISSSTTITFTSFVNQTIIVQSGTGTFSAGVAIIEIEYVGYSAVSSTHLFLINFSQ